MNDKPKHFTLKCPKCKMKFTPKRFSEQDIRHNKILFSLHLETHEPKRYE